ncbi:MAG: DMT family transporter [Verrucomicrobiota bacterium]
MLSFKSNAAISASLVLAIFLWGGTNIGVKYMVGFWPPIWTGCSRFLCASLLLLGMLRWTDWLGTPTHVSKELKRSLWWRGGLSLAVYIVAFNWALRFTSASHMALYLGASPVWALLWEGRPERNWRSMQRYGAAVIALTGVFVLFWPALKGGRNLWLGELLALAASILWTNYGRQCRIFGAQMSGVEITAQTMWRAAVLLFPLVLAEVSSQGLVWRTDLVLIQIYCTMAGGVVAFVLWNNALRHWPTSQVFLFNNLIPLSTMAWANLCLNEPVTRTFGVAMLLIVSAVILGRTNWQILLRYRWMPPE